MSAPIPPPHEPITDKEGRMNDVWYRFFEGNFTALTTAEGSLSSRLPSTLPIPVSEGGTGQITAAEAVGELIQALTENTTSAKSARYIATYNSGSDTGDKLPLGNAMISTGTAVATTGTTGVTVSAAIPGNAIRLELVMQDVGLTTTHPWYLQLGTTAGIDNTGYVASGLSFNTSGSAQVNSTLGVPFFSNSAARGYTGSITISNQTSNLWVISYSGVGVDPTLAGAVSMSGGGYKTLGGPLARIDIVTTGAHVFDSGQANIFWEF